VEVDKIDHEAVPQAIEQVAERTANNKGIGDVVQLLLRRTAVHHHQQHRHDSDGDTGEEPALPAAVIGQEAERGTVVARIEQIERRISGWDWPSTKLPRIHCLLAKSSTSTTTTNHSQRKP